MMSTTVVQNGEKKVVHVTSAQVQAARALIKYRERVGIPVTDAQRKIAEAGA